jgi:hypothetical protein
MAYTGSPAVVKAKRAASRRRNLEHHLAKKRVWRTENRPKARKSSERSRFRSVYRSELERKEQWLRAQGGRCAICHTDTPGKKGWHFDADHTNDPPFLRGVLCGRCNMGLGLFLHSIPAIKSASTYLCDRGQ